MPELPEVETIRRGLEAVLPGEKVKLVSVLREKSFRGASESLHDVSITKVERRGKLLIMTLDDGRALTCHLKMTGQLLYRAKDGRQVMGGHPDVEYVNNLPGRHTRVMMEFFSGAELFFNDLRVFGYVQVMTSEELRELPFLVGLGPEPFEKAFTIAYLVERLAKRPKSVLKSFLLDQTQIAGLGNIYADESCFRSGIDPRRLSGSLQKSEVEALHKAVVEVLTLAIEHGGSSSKDYLNAIGEKGTYLNVAQVYHRTGKPCPRCGQDHVIMRVKIGGRSTHFCQNCQK